MSCAPASIIATTLLLIAGSAFAQSRAMTVNYGAPQPLEETLEWMVCDSQDVVHATIEAGPGEQINFKVIEAIKGELTAGSILSVEKLPSLQQHRFAPGQTVLLFLQENKGRTASQFPLRLRGGRGGFVLDGTEVAFLMNCTSVSRPPDVLASAKAAAAVGSTAKDYALLPCNIPGVSRILLLPVDQRLQALAQQWAAGKSLAQRVMAMRALEKFKSDANIALAMDALRDTRSLTPVGLSKWQMGYYHARAAANDLLSKWNVPHPILQESGPIYIYQPLELSRGSLITAAAMLVVVIAAMLIWRRATMVRWITVLLAMLGIVALSLLWRRSIWRVDEVMFSAGTSHHEIASYRGGIQYVVMGEWTLQSDPVMGHFDLGWFADAWSTDMLVPKPKARLGGFIAQRVTGAGPGSAIHPVTLLRIPYWAMIVPFALLLISQSWVVVRQLRRRRLGLCRNCGYDLRESKSDKCPECGVSIRSGVRSKAGQKIAIGDHPVGV